MGKIQARVSQGTGDDDKLANIVNSTIIVSLNPEDSNTTVPSNLSCSLTIGSGVATTPSSSAVNSQRGVDLTYSYNVVGGPAPGQSYSLTSFQNVPSGDTVDGTSGTVQSGSFTSEAVKVPAPGSAGNTMSFWQKIIQFFRRLFGFKML